MRAPRKAASKRRCASFSLYWSSSDWIGIMAESQVKWPTTYNVGPHNHLHALGVISNNYNEFNSGLYALFVTQLVAQKLPRKLIDLFYFSVNENRRLEYLKQVFANYERDPKVVICINAIDKYFEWCSEARNTLIHATHAPPSFFKIAEEALYLSKRSKGQTTLNYMRLSLPNLRRVADQIRIGVESCNDLNFFLALRDHGANLTADELKLFGDVSLPKIPAPPRKLKLSKTPYNPVVRKALQKQLKEKS
jgi:hypothetical protein